MSIPDARARGPGTAESVELTPTELGTLEDLITTTKRVRPAGIHFSGHGAPGHLQFEDDEGRSDRVGIAELAGKLKGLVDVLMLDGRPGRAGRPVGVTLRPGGTAASSPGFQPGVAPERRR